MAKAIDYIASRFAIFMLLLIWFNYITNSFYISAIYTIILFTIICGIIEWAKSSKKDNTYSYDKFSKQLALMGNNYTINLYAKAFNKNIELIKDNKIYEPDKITICNYKFSDIGIEDIASAYRLSLEKDIKNLTIICKGANRESLLLAENLPIKFEFIKGNALFKQLKIKETVPPLIKMEKRTMKNISIKSIVDIVLSTTNTKHFIFSGGILGLMSFITPLKLYYIIMSTASFIFALLTVIYPKIKQKMTM